MRPTFLYFLTIILIAQIVSAQPAAIDPTFNPADVGYGRGDGANDDIMSVMTLTNGKSLITGDFTQYNAITGRGIARINIDGTIDPSFSIGAGANGYIGSCSVQTDGKIIIYGSFTSFNGTLINRITRLNPSGTIDPSFNIGTGANAPVRSSAVQSDGKIIIGGQFTTFNGISLNSVARLNSDGSLDNSFNPGTGANGYVFYCSLQNDGKILIGGAFTTFNGVARNRIARLNVDGSLDITFNPGSGVNDFVRCCKVQSDGKIIVCGQFTTYNGSSRNRIVRLNTDGSIDGTFNMGTGTNAFYVNSCEILTNGKIVIAGRFTTYNGNPCNGVARINNDGTIDATFSPPSFNLIDGIVDCAAVQQDDKVIIGGLFIYYNGIIKNRITRLNSSGSFDISFNPGSAANLYVYCNVLQPDGKILIGGDFTAYNGFNSRKLARLMPDGTFDNTFNPGGAGPNNSVRHCAIQSDGKIIIAGEFIHYNGDINKVRITRLNTDGTLDPTFNTGFSSNSGANNIVLFCGIQTDGKIIICGTFTSVNATPRNRIARLNSDGTLDQTFNPGTGANNTVWSFAIQPNNKILINGDFTQFNGTTRSRIARLNADGSLDLTFNPGSGFNASVNSSDLQADGKIVVGGYFTSFNGITKNYITRLNADGSIDATFNTGVGANNFVNVCRIGPDGKIIIGGNFTLVNNNSKTRIARLNSDGSLDNSFDPGIGTNGAVLGCSLLPNGRIIISGDFIYYNTTGRNRIARLFGNDVLPILSLNPVNPYYPNQNISVAFCQCGTFQSSNTFSVQLSDANGSFSNPTIIGTVIGNSNGTIPCTIPSNAPNGTGYRMRVVSSNPIITGTDNGFDLSIMYIPTIINPQITLSNVSVNAGQSINFFGNNFTPNSVAGLTINNANGFIQTITNISINSIGGFNYSYTTNSSQEGGIYNIKAKDQSTGLESIIRTYNLIGATIPSNLEITFPYSSITLDPNQTVFFEFIDKMILSSLYQITNSQRNYKYLVDLSSDNGVTWQTLTSIQGIANINSYVPLHYFFTIGTPGTYKIRVKDFYVPSNFIISSSITISNIVSTSNINVSYKWDFSYPQPSSNIAGISADGASRFFIEVSKVNPNVGSSISSVSVSLNDAFNGLNPVLLGRVTKANQYLTYSSEANGISTISATNNTPNISKYVFWYLSPDDFVGSDPNDQTSSTRFVNAIFTINYSSGTTETVPKKITIVRPPLMLVHGLASDHTTWDNFSNGSSVNPTKYLTDYRFKQVSPIDISPNASFALNAFNITIGQPNNFSNSFPGVISEMRSKGYVCNRVDYVCHSMGGCVLRSALDNELDLFRRTGSAINRPYKNYEKGYVNKVITIGTPHFGSPVADIVNRYVSGLPHAVRCTLATFSSFPNGEKTFPFMFIQQDGNSPWYSPQFEATDAVKNLQINSNNGGVNFQQAYVRAHVIAGDIIPGRQLNLPGGLIPQSLIDQVANMGNNYLERFVNYLLDYAVAHEPDPIIKAAAMNALSKNEAIDRALTFLDNLTLALDVANYGTFMPESDLIVGVGSQTAGFYETDPNVSIVDNFVAHAIIHSETKNLDIGNYVMQMLNTAISSTAFNLLPATPSTPAFPIVNQMSLMNNVTNTDTLIAKTDTNRIVIVQPNNNSSIKVDSVITVKVNVKDTLNLITINLYFQDKTYKLPKSLGLINLQIQVNSNAVGNQKISVEGFYDYQDSSVLAIDEKNLNIINQESINSFSVSPEIFNLTVGEKTSANFVAVFQTYVLSSSTLNDLIYVAISDTTVLRFDTITHEFVANKIGTTFASVEYLGLFDTVYFEITKGAENSLASFSSSSQRICSGTSINFVNESFGTTSSIKWTFVGGTPSTSTDNSPNVVYANPGLYNVTLIAQYLDKVDTLVMANYVTVDTCQSLLSIKVFIDGYYLGNNQMKPVLSNLSSLYPAGSCDSIFLDFKTTESPYPTEYNTSALVDVNGNASFMIPNSMVGKSYFISIKHHKSLTAWTNTPITVTSSPITLNFINSANLVYGNNLRQLLDGKFALYSGDVDQNGLIDIIDVNILENNCQIKTLGFSFEDLTGDGIVESTDYSIIENNIGKFIMKP